MDDNVKRTTTKKENTTKHKDPINFAAFAVINFHTKILSVWKLTLSFDVSE